MFGVSVGSLDIQSFCRVIRGEEARLDITLTISILEVWGYDIRCNSSPASALEVIEKRRRDIIP